MSLPSPSSPPCTFRPKSAWKALVFLLAFPLGATAYVVLEQAVGGLPLSRELALTGLVVLTGLWVPVAWLLAGRMLCALHVDAVGIHRLGVPGHEQHVRWNQLQHLTVVHGPAGRELVLTANGRRLALSEDHYLEGELAVALILRRAFLLGIPVDGQA